jgi:hypothetical protein
MFLKQFFCKHDFEFFYLFKLKKCLKCGSTRKFIVLDQLNWYEAELNKYKCLSRELMTYDEIIMVDNKIIQLKAWIGNIEDQFDKNNQ